MNVRNLRLALKNQVMLVWHGLNTPANIENISATGALVRADLPVRIGDLMSLHIEDKSWPDAIDMDGEVVRVGLMRRDMPAFGVRFSKVPEELRLFLRHTSIKHNATLGA